MDEEGLSVIRRTIEGTISKWKKQVPAIHSKVSPFSSAKNIHHFPKAAQIMTKHKSPTNWTDLWMEIRTPRNGLVVVRRWFTTNRTDLSFWTILIIFGQRRSRCTNPAWCKAETHRKTHRMAILHSSKPSNSLTLTWFASRSIRIPFGAKLIWSGCNSRTWIPYDLGEACIIPWDKCPGQLFSS